MQQKWNVWDTAWSVQRWIKRSVQRLIKWSVQQLTLSRVNSIIERTRCGQAFLDRKFFND